MTLPTFSMKELLEAGIHFGHQINRWNPKMQTYLYGERNGIHIIDLQQTVPLLYSAMKILRDVAASGGRILFVGTKRQAQKIISETATECGQYFINHRWLGGTLTNWNTISNSITRLKKFEEILSGEESGLTKKELVGLTRQRDKLKMSLGGIQDMGGKPDALFVIDTNKERIAVNEARVLEIPVVGILDSNSDPDGIDHPIPGNDDATRAISLYCRLVSASILDGLQESFKHSGKDIGKSDSGLTENLENIKPQKKVLDLSENKKLKGKTLNEKAIKQDEANKKSFKTENKVLIEKDDEASQPTKDTKGPETPNLNNKSKENTKGPKDTSSQKERTATKPKSVFEEKNKKTENKEKSSIKEEK